VVAAGLFTGQIPASLELAGCSDDDTIDMNDCRMETGIESAPPRSAEPSPDSGDQTAESGNE